MLEAQTCSAVIDAPDLLCGTYAAGASLQPPTSGGQWMSTTWSMTGGHLLDANGNPASTVTGPPYITFNADGSGPVTLTAQATDQFGCLTPQASEQIPVLSGPPVVVVAPEVCAHSVSPASVAPPAAGTWTSVEWRISHGQLREPGGPWRLFAYGETVEFRATGSAPVELEVTTQHSSGCPLPPAFTTVGIREGTAPVITAPSQVCPNDDNTASVAPPSVGSWSTVYWSITNGSFRDQWGYTTSSTIGETVTFFANGYGPVTLYAQGTDTEGCDPQTGTAQVELRQLPAPVIDAPAEVCPHTSQYASLQPPAEGEWALVYWSIQNGHFVTEWGPQPNASGPNAMFVANGYGPVTLSVSAMDDQGCYSPMGTRTVEMRTIAAPVIDAPAQVCPHTSQYASVQPPAEGSWSMVYWSIQNGYFTDYLGQQTTSATGTSVMFVANGSGPVTLSIGAQDDQGCYSPMGTRTVEIRTIPAPAIEAPVQVCPHTSQYASVLPPAEGTWSMVYWSIQNGYFTDYLGNQTTSSIGNGVMFVANGAGPVMLSVGAQDDQGCYSPMGTRSVEIRTIPAPVIEAPVQVCPHTSQYAAVLPPAEGTWSMVYWSIQNGYFTDYLGNQTTSSIGNGVMFVANGAGPVMLSVGAQDDQGCYSPMGTRSVDIRTIPAPSFSVPASVCPNTSQYAAVLPPAEGSWSMVYWSIQNGYFTDYLGNQTTSASGNGVTFVATGTEPVVLSAGGQDSQGCYSPMGTVTVSIATVEPPVISAPEGVCPNVPATASVAPPAEGSWSQVQWTITNGFFTSPNTTGETVEFITTGGEPVVLQASATNASGCTTTVASATVPITYLPAPVINAPANICYGEPSTASVDPPAEGEWVSVWWTITNGELASPMGGGTDSTMGNPVGFRANGNGPVTLTATVSDATGCTSVVATKEIALRVVDPPAINAPSNVCPGQNASASITQISPDPFTYVSWSITNGTLQNVDPEGMAITFQADGTGPVTLTATGNTVAGCWTAESTRTVAIRTIAPAAINAPSAICATDPATASAVPPSGGGSWATAAWTITNGTFSNGQTSFNGTDVTFTANGSGAVTLNFSGTDSFGCVAAPASVTIPYENVIAPTLTAPADACTNAQFTVTVNGSGFTGYNWTVINGETGINNTTSGQVLPDGNGPVTITVQAFTTAGCMREVSVTVPLVAPPDTTITSPDSMCAGTAVMASVPDGGADASYVWTLQGGQVKAGWSAYEREIVFEPFAGSTSVTLTALVYRPNSCYSNSTKVVTVNPVPTAAVEPHPSRICENDTLTLTASEDRAGATYNWNIVGAPVLSGQGTRTIVIQTQFDSYRVDYTLDVSLNGCSKSSSGSVDVSNLNRNVAFSGATRFCQGGSVTLTAQPGYTYLWSNQSQAQSIVVSESGSYTVQITDQYGCSQTSDPVVVTVDPTPVVDIEVRTSYSETGSGGIVQQNGDTYEICGNPTIALIPTVLNQANTYSWSNNGTPVNYVTTSGTYTLTMTDANGCSTTSAVTLIFTAYPAKPTVTASSTQLCPAGGSVTLTASAADSWTWSNGATTQSITVTEPGSYSVRVSNRFCESVPSDAVVVTTGVSTITVTGSTNLCANGSVTLTANGGDAWQWSNGATTQSITVSTPDSYSVITSNNGCTYTASNPVAVTQREVTVSASGPTTFCDGSSVTLTASADGATSFQWNNGAQGASFAAWQTGTYYVTATYSDGCTVTSDPVTVEARQITATATADRTSVCPGGAISLDGSATGGSGYTYQWYDNTYTAIAGGSSAQFTYTPSTSGFVYLKVIDALGCETNSNAISYTVQSAIDASITAPDAVCEGGSGTASVADAGTNATYAWSITGGTISFPSNREVFFTPSGLGAVTLTVTVTNPGCSAASTKTVTVNALPPATITASGDLSFCQGGSVTLTAPAGYSYVWNNGETGPSINVTTSGTYRVTVTDANGCSRTSADTVVTVNTPPATPTVTASGALSFCQGGSVTLTAPAGYSYLWNNGEDDQSIVVTNSGPYRVTITDANGCTATSADTVVTVNTPPATPTVTASGALTFCQGGSVTLTAPAGYSYLWNNGEDDQSIVVTNSGPYRVTITDANGCTATSADTVVTVNTPPATPTVTASGALSFCQGGSVTLSAPAGYSYLWNNGEDDQSIVVTNSGPYRVTITDANGCTATSPDTVVTVNTPPATPTVTASGALSFCQGGSVTLSAPAGYSYLWNNGEDDQSIVVTTSGVYRVTVTDANGCTSTSADTTVTVNPLPAAPVVSGPTSICPNSSITLTAPAGYASYVWNNGTNGPTLNVTQAGNYYITVTNASGCARQSATHTVAANPATAISTQPANVTMPRNSPRTLSVVATGTPTLQYQWYNGFSGDTSSPIAGATNSTLTIQHSKKGTYRYWVRVSSSTCTTSVVNSNTATVTVN